MRPALARTNTTLWWIACALVCAVYVFSAPRVWQCEGVDEIEYLGLAHSIARDFGYTLYGQPYVVYPPLYPFVLSLILGHGAGLWRWLYAANALFGAMGLIAGATWLRSRFGRAGNWAGWFTIFSYFAWSFSTRYLLSEPLFFALSVAALALAWRVLCGERAPGWMALLAAVGALLCAATRFGAVALTAALCISALLKWIRERSRVALLLLVAVAVLGGGFAVAWEARARLVDPGAVESYARWTQKAIGVSSESTGMIAQSVGEGTDAKKGWPERAVALGVRYGQYVLSNVRVSAVAVPFALFLGLVFLTGLFLHLVRCSWSPVGWYTAISLAVISLTSWFSSYTRYLYPLTPFLFLFLLEGARAWRAGVFGRGAVWMRLCMVLCGVGGLIGSIMNWPCDDSATAEGAYVAAVAGLCVLAYMSMLVVGIRPGMARSFAMNDRIVGACMAALILASALQTSLIVAARSKLTAQNHTLVQRNLAAVVAAGDWLRDNSDRQAVCLSSLPRLTAFLSDRKYAALKYTSTGELDLEGIDYVVRMGALVDVPAFRPADEDRLVEGLNTALQKSQVVQVFTSGDAAVYRVAKP